MEKKILVLIIVIIAIIIIGFLTYQNSIKSEMGNEMKMQNIITKYNY